MSMGRFQWLHHAWNNGERALILATAYLVGASALLVSVILFSFCSREDEFSPLRNVVPQDVPIHTAVPGGTLTVNAVKCNDSNKAVGVEGSVFLRNRDNPAILVAIRERGMVVREPGCVTKQYKNPIPFDVPPGRYRLEGVDITRAGDKEQREPWWTEDFLILAE